MCALTSVSSRLCFEAETAAGQVERREGTKPMAKPGDHKKMAAIYISTWLDSSTITSYYIIPVLPQATVERCERKSSPLGTPPLLININYQKEIIIVIITCTSSRVA